MALSVGVICGGMWLAAKSPLFRWVGELVALLLVMFSGFLLGLGGVVFVHLPKGNYGMALLCLLIGIGLSWPCVMLGWDRLRQLRREFRDSLQLWGA